MMTETVKSENLDISSLLFDDLVPFMEQIGEPKYRAEQLFRGFSQGKTVEEMTDIGKGLRAKLAERSRWADLEQVRKLTDPDGTEKFLFRLPDSHVIETVFMRYKHGNSVCISSQVGCRMGCRFCASTLLGKVRNLSAGEMLAQVARVNAVNKVSNIVIMGVGEPLDNYENLLLFLQNVNDPKGLNIGYRHISVSTCGLVDRMEQLAQRRFPITLSVSLHAPDDETRNRLMPVNRKYPVATLMQACRDYIAVTGRRISFEYTLVKEINDTPRHAALLASLVRGMLCHVNLIPVNYVAERGLEPSSSGTIEKFRRILAEKGVNVTVRRRLGSEINASCGQLRHQYMKEQ